MKLTGRLEKVAEHRPERTAGLHHAEGVIVMHPAGAPVYGFAFIDARLLRRAADAPAAVSE